VSLKESSDTHFFNSFSLVLGILIFIAILLFIWARDLGHQQVDNQHTESYQLDAVRANIEPFAHIAIAGKDNSALAALEAPKAAPAAMEIPKTGEAAYTAVCSACHGQGINGAPKIGDHAAWGPRIAQGKATLYAHAISGKGAMPPRGGTTWPDATIHMTVDYMLTLNSK
jgi:cytochrome c5